MSALNTSVGQRASDVVRRHGVPLAGDIAAYPPAAPYETVDVINSAGRVLETRLITIAGATNATTYDLTINGEATVTYLSDGSATDVEIAAGLLAACQEDPAFGEHVSATYVSTTSFRLTAHTQSNAVAVTSTQSGGDITIGALTSNAAADNIYAGRALVISSTDDNGNNQGGTVLSTRLVADVWTVAAVYAASEIYIVELDFEGQTYRAQVAADTDTATTNAAIAARINAIMPANTVVAAAGATSLTLTSEKPGAPIERVSANTNTSTVSRIVLTHTTASVGTDLNRVFAGISVRRYDNEATDDTQLSYYPAGDCVVGLVEGEIWVDCSSAVTPMDRVFVETATGTDQGKLFPTTSATRVLLNGARWERRRAADNRAVVRLRRV